MAKFKLDLDKRVKLKDGKYNLSVRMCHKNDVIFLKIVPITQEQYEKVFVRKADDKKSTEFRNECQGFLGRCETIFSDMNPFDKKRFREKVYGKEDANRIEEVSFKLKDLIDRFLDSRETVKLHTKDMYKTAVNKFDSLKPDLTILDITPALLMEFEKRMLDDDASPFTVSSYMRHVRSMVNHFMIVDKIIPKNFKYPFGKNGGYVIRKGRSLKLVMSNAEIKKVLELCDFQNTEEEYARDCWALTYLCNGQNYQDLFRLKWTNIHDDLIILSRTKTENTTRNNARDIVIPIIPKLRELIEKIGVKNSPYILGHLQKGYVEKKLRSQKDWQLHKIRTGLNSIDERLNLSVPLKMKTARDCYNNVLKRAGWDQNTRGDMMGHSPGNILAAHYDGVIDKERLFEINSCLVNL